MKPTSTQHKEVFAQGVRGQSWQGGGIVVHAPPFREEFYIPEIRLFPEYVDAMEAINASHSSPVSVSPKNPEYNERAIAYVKEHHFPMTAGSDQHRQDMIGSGMVFPRKIKDIRDFCEAVL